MSLVTILSAAALGISLVITVVKAIDGFVHTDPRTLLRVITLLLFLAVIASIPCVIVLLIYQQWAAAMMLAASVLIVLILSNWQSILARVDWQPVASSSPARGHHYPPAPDAELAQRAAVVLEDYLAHINQRDRPVRIEAMRRCLSTDEALDVLGLAQGASANAIRAAHRRLMQLVHPDRGGTTYLAAQVNEAKDTLLAQATARSPQRRAARQRGEIQDG